MKTFVIFVAAFVSIATNAQKVEWQKLIQPFQPEKTTPIVLSRERRARLGSLLLRSRTVWQSCDGDSSWLGGLRVSLLPHTTPQILLVEAGPGCASGTVNSAMWLVEWKGNTPVLLGTPNGWLYKVVPANYGRFPDVIAGWNMSGKETDMTLYRFDGRRYEKESSADVICPDGDYDRCVIRPDPQIH